MKKEEEAMVMYKQFANATNYSDQEHIFMELSKME